MALHPRRVATTTFLLVGLAAAILFVLHLRAVAPPAVDPGPWIPLPVSGMDASDAAVRALLEQKLRWGNDGDLIRNCGGGARDVGTRYRLFVERDAWGPGRILELAPHGDRVAVSVRFLGSAPPPPPPPGPRSPKPARRAGPRAEPEPAPVSLVLRASALDALRAAWIEPSLWDAPQQANAIDCLDGDAVILEACVGGRYAARLRNCDARAEPATRHLWKIVETQFPAPD